MKDLFLHKKKRILFNCSTNIVGGAIQNAYNFIINALQDKDFEWLFLVSSQINNQLAKSQVVDERIITIQESPSKSSKSRKFIRVQEAKFCPDIIFTMAGPAYVDFKNYHIMGLSNAYLTHAEFKAFFFGRELKELIKVFFTVLYQALYARKADFFFFQTESSRKSFCKRFRVNILKTALIPNVIGNVFTQNSQFEKDDNHTTNIFCPAAAFPHKSVHIIPQIAKKMADTLQHFNYKFTLTLPQDSNLWGKIKSQALKLDVLHLIENIGPFDYKNAAELHARADIIFIPSILETFSTSYLEGIISKKPLLVSNLPFAKEVCGEHALYFKPFSVQSATLMLKKIILNYDYYRKIFSKNTNVLDKFGDQYVRYQTIKSHLLKISI